MYLDVSDRNCIFRIQRISNGVDGVSYEVHVGSRDVVILIMHKTKISPRYMKQYTTAQQRSVRIYPWAMAATTAGWQVEGCRRWMLVPQQIRDGGPMNPEGPQRI